MGFTRGGGRHNGDEDGVARREWKGEEEERDGNAAGQWV